MMNKKQGIGFTLIELMIAVAIAGVLASMAVPTFSKMIERNRLKEAVEGLKSDMMWMRTETMKKSCNLQVTFDTSVWSYTIFRTDGTCGCPTGGGNCTDKSVNGTQFAGTIMTSNSIAGGGSSSLFDFKRGTVAIANTGNTRLSTTNYTVKVIVSKVGRVRICNLADQDGLLGYEEC